MELKATALGKRMAQHPYDRAEILNAGIKVSGERHEYLIPFNQLLSIHCKRGLVWGEMEFVLPDNQVVRLHGTEWSETQRFHQHLNARWQQWSAEMSGVAAELLNQQLLVISQNGAESQWLTRQHTATLQQKITQALQALPVPTSRLDGFDNCREPWRRCQAWLNDIDNSRLQHNQDYTDAMLSQHAAFFASVESSPLNPAQARAVVNGEHSLLVLAGAGSGKTSVLVAKAGWLLQRAQACTDQILLLAFGRQAAQEMDERIRARLHTEEITARTFHALALHIIEQGSKKVPAISQLENDTAARQQLLIQVWQQQCQEKKASANGWRQWLEEDMDWHVPEGNFWHDDPLINRIGSRLDRWVSLLRMHGGSQAEMIAAAPEEIRELFGKRVKLMAPLLKAWKTALKEENAVDFPGLIHQAVNVLEKARFISPWKHILVDEFQDISPQRAALLAALRKQNSQTTLFAVGDDWQAIYRFSGAQLSLTTAFNHSFGDGDSCALDTTYRFNSRIGEVANRFIQQNPHQLTKPLNSLSHGDKKAVLLLPDDQLDGLLDKLSGFATSEQRILILARYHHLKPAGLEQAATRWPKLHIDFMTIHASKGQQADYVIVLGLQEGQDAFPATVRESIIEQALLPQPEDFPDAEERRLLYVAITRARQRVWLLFNKEQPSRFVEALQQLGVPVTRKP